MTRRVVSTPPFLLPERATLVEVGPRDGFQFETTPVPTRMKLELISALAAAGISEIQVAAFVRPDAVPQMADAEALIAMLPKPVGVRYTGLVLNVRGIERAAASGLSTVEVSVSASDTHSRRNAGMSRTRARKQGLEMIRRASAAGMRVHASVQCAFGCAYEGPIPAERVAAMGESFLSAGADLLSLADTTGMADPIAVHTQVTELAAAVGDAPLGLHLHDTRGLGLVNVMAGLACGITRYDTAFGGMGGCPFVPGAAGNIATEDTVHLFDVLGVATGVDIDGVAACTRRIEALLGKRFPVKNRGEVP